MQLIPCSFVYISSSGLWGADVGNFVLNIVLKRVIKVSFPESVMLAVLLVNIIIWSIEQLKYVW